MERNDVIARAVVFTVGAGVTLYGMWQVGGSVYSSTGSIWQSLAAAEVGGKVYGTLGIIAGVGVLGAGVAGKSFLEGLKEIPTRMKLDKFVKTNSQFSGRYEDLQRLDKDLKRKYPRRDGIKTVLNMLGDNKFHSVDFEKFSNFVYAVMKSKNPKLLIDAEIEYGKGLKKYSNEIKRLQKENNVESKLKQGDIEKIYDLYSNYDFLKKHYSPEKMYNCDSMSDVNKMYNLLDCKLLTGIPKNSLNYDAFKIREEGKDAFVSIELEGKKYDLGKCKCEPDKIWFNPGNIKQGDREGLKVYFEFQKAYTELRKHKNIHGYETRFDQIVRESNEQEKQDFKKIYGKYYNDISSHEKIVDLSIEDKVVNKSSKGRSM